MRQVLILSLGMVLGSVGFYGVNTLLERHEASSPYAGQEARQVTSLSADDVRALTAGEGWGLAKPAELNGFPGPAHVLELAEKLDLTDGQKRAIERSFAEMNQRARKLGSDLIDAEAALDAAFRSDLISAQVLDEKLNAAASVRAALRSVHLSAHLEITPLLSKAQKQRYAQLRGYGDGQSGHQGH